MAEGTRRELLRRAALVVCTPVLGKVLSGCVRRIDAARDQSVPPSNAGVLAVPLALVPELVDAGGFVVVHSSDVGDPPLLLINAGSGADGTVGYLAIFAICPHAGCELAWVAEDNEVECPCHGSRFARDGTVLHPPAVSGVPTFPVTADGRGNLLVRLA
jgi:Rieske Fe-S protein